jgi:hypothetical protein
MSLDVKDLDQNLLLPFSYCDSAVNRILLSTDTSPGPSNTVQLAAYGLDDGGSRPLASPERSSLARLRDTNREAWFVDDETLARAARPNAAPSAANA